MNELKIYCYEMIFDTSLNQNYILNIENPKILREFIGALQNKDDSKIYYMKNYQIVGKFDKNILYLPSVSMIDFDKKLTQSYYDIIQDNFLNSEKKELINSINSQIMELLDLTSLDTSVEIDYSNIISYKDILSLAKVKIVDSSDSYIAKIVLYLKLLKDFNDYKILIIPFLDAYLTTDEIRDLTKELKLLNVSLFVVTNNDLNLENFDKYTIDKDLCEF